MNEVGYIRVSSMRSKWALRRGGAGGVQEGWFVHVCASGLALPCYD